MCVCFCGFFGCVAWTFDGGQQGAALGPGGPVRRVHEPAGGAFAVRPAAAVRVRGRPARAAGPARLDRGRHDGGAAGGVGGGAAAGRAVRRLLGVQVAPPRRPALRAPQLDPQLDPQQPLLQLAGLVGRQRRRLGRIPHRSRSAVCFRLSSYNQGVFIDFVPG